MSQTETPENFNTIWRIAGWVDEHPLARRRVEIIHYTQDQHGRECVKVKILDRFDLFEPETCLISPHMLLPS